jgi:hypothetical protein
MRFVRENLFYVILIGVTVIAGSVELVLSFTMDVDKELKKRTGLSRSLSNFARRKDKVNNAIAGRMKKRIEVLREAAQKDEQASIEFNKQNLNVLQLQSGVTGTAAFPIDPALYKRESLRYVFTKTYGDTLKAMVLDPRLRATQPPTNAEIREEEAILKERMANAAELAVRSMTIKKAQRGMIYVSEGSLDRYFTAPKAMASDTELWEAQINLWVTQEILRAIMTTNDEVANERQQAGLEAVDEANVLTAAVKRLEKVTIGESFVFPTAAFTGQLQAVGTLTQRSTVADYGVIQYKLTVVVPTRYLEKLLRNLTTQNYHVVLNVEMAKPVLGKNERYYYGTDPVMKVEITAELLLLPQWLRPLMPPSVADKLPGAAAAK